MPAAKKAARKATKRTTKKATKRSAQRTLSAAHKRALAEGRTMSATVDRYLSAVNTPKQRGRKVSKSDRLSAPNAIMPKPARYRIRSSPKRSGGSQEN